FAPFVNSILVRAGAGISPPRSATVVASGAYTRNVIRLSADTSGDVNCGAAGWPPRPAGAGAVGAGAGACCIVAATIRGRRRMVVMFMGAECTTVSEGAEVTEFTMKERRKRRRTEKKSLGFCRKNKTFFFDVSVFSV